MTIVEAELCYQAGVDVIVVSNGGWALVYTPGTAKEILRDIAARSKGS